MASEKWRAVLLALEPGPVEGPHRAWQALGSGLRLIGLSRGLCAPPATSVSERNLQGEPVIGLSQAAPHAAFGNPQKRGRATRPARCRLGLDDEILSQPPAEGLGDCGLGLAGRDSRCQDLTEALPEPIEGIACRRSFAGRCSRCGSHFGKSHFRNVRLVRRDPVAK